MKFPGLRRPSASMAVALTALVLAASGTAVAASGLVTGDQLIKPRSLSGNRLRNHSVTGQQVAARTLGKVASAKKADRAFVAGSAQNAVNAQDAQVATSAHNATLLGGLPSSSFMPATDRVGTSGVTKLAGTPAGATTTLFTFGPFTVTMRCTKSGSNTSLSVTATSSEANSVVAGQLVPSANSSVPIGPDVSPASGFHESTASGRDFEAPSGAEAIFAAADGVNSLGTDCWANWVGMR